MSNQFTNRQRIARSGKIGIEERKNREKEERRSLILKAAIKIYDEEGYHGTTMEKIANAAELSRGTLYLYFKTKDEIFVHAIVSRSNYFGDLLETTASGDYNAPDKLIEALWSNFRDFYNYDPVVFNLTLYFHQMEMLRRLPGTLRTMLDSSGTRNYRLLTTIMRYGIEKGFFVKCDPRTLAEVVWTSFLGIIHIENSKKAMGRKNHIEITCDLAIRILSRGIINPDHDRERV